MIVITVRGKWKRSGIKKTNVILTNQGYWTLSLASGPGVNRVLSVRFLCCIVYHVYSHYQKVWQILLTVHDHQGLKSFLRAACHSQCETHSFHTGSF